MGTLSEDGFRNLCQPCQPGGFGAAPVAGSMAGGGEHSSEISSLIVSCTAESVSRMASLVIKLSSISIVSPMLDRLSAMLPALIVFLH